MAEYLNILFWPKEAKDKRHGEKERGKDRCE